MSETLTSLDQKYHRGDGRMFENPNRNLEADRRLSTLNDVIVSYQAEHDFVEGATVFGSTMHGDAHERSDVDAMIFIDPDKLTQETGEDFDEKDYKDMASVIQYELNDKLGLSDIDISSGKRNDIRVLPVNPRIVTEQITKFSRELQNSSEDEDPSLPSSITALFHPAVGENTPISELRANVIKEIKRSEDPQKLWDEIVRRAWFFEGDTHNEESKIPELFEDGAKVYGKASER